jgi:diadenosine tetraphosphate (Ap4A) HIT family hydrolase
MNSAFALDSALAQSTLPVGDLALCAVLLQNDSRFPADARAAREGVVELTDLPDEDYRQLADEIRVATRGDAGTRQARQGERGEIGNLVPQMHVHVIGRFRSDPAWPAPCGASAPAPLSRPRAAALIERARAFLGGVPLETAPRLRVELPARAPFLA